MTNTNWESQLSQDTISFSIAFKGGLFIVVVAAIAMGIAAFFNQQRQERVIVRYTQETELYLAKNEEAVKRLYTSIFDTCQLEYEATRSGTTYYSDISCSAAKDHFSLLNLDQLKDSSAIAFLKERNGDQYALIEASGNYRYFRSADQGYFFNWSKKDDLINYLQHGQEITMWEDFLTYIPGKEVIVPVEYEGQLYGYLFRGVIEK